MPPSPHPFAAPSTAITVACASGSARDGVAPPPVDPETPAARAAALAIVDGRPLPAETTGIARPASRGLPRVGVLGMLTDLTRGVPLAAALLGCGLACGGGVDGPRASPAPVGPAMRVVSGADVTDTVDAALAAPLVVEVADSSGHPAANVRVVFTSPPLPAPAACTGIAACYPNGAVFTKTDLQTDVQGRVSVPLSLGPVAGAARFVVTAPTLGVHDTARYTILPGRAARATIAPHDTCVYVGTTSTLRGAVLDRYGNPRPEAPTLVGPAATPVTGLSVSATTFGVFAIMAQVAGAAADTARVCVVPHGTIAALAGFMPNGPDTLVAVDLDGTPRARFSAGGRVNGLAWTPDGARLVFARTDGPGYRLYATTLTGTPAPLVDARTPTDQQKPAFSHDGRWLFFAEADATTSTFRLWRANADGTAAQRVGGTAGGTPGTIATTLAPSADGGRVAYSAPRAVGTGDSLRVLDLASGTVTTFRGLYFEPRWSPHDDLIAYISPYGAGLVTPADAFVRQFAPSPTPPDVFLDWSPDERWLVVRSSVRLELLDVTSASGARIPLPYTRGFVVPVWKP